MYITKKLNECQVGEIQEDSCTNYSKDAERQKQKENLKMRMRKTAHRGLGNLKKIITTNFSSELIRVQR